MSLVPLLASNERSAHAQDNLHRFDIGNWLAINVPLESSVDSADGLAVATGGAREANVTVQMAQEGDEAARRKLKEEEAEAKRKANALPVWISQSTISGDLTAAGVREGSAGPSRPAPASPTKEAKPSLADDDDDLDAYFAATQHDSNVRSPSPDRPPPYSRPGSVASSSGVGAKRSRSREQDEGYASLENLRDLAAEADEDDEESGRHPKKARTSAESSPAAPAEPVTPMDDDATGDFEEVKLVSCGGKMMPLNEITDDMATQLMVSCRRALPLKAAARSHVFRLARSTLPTSTSSCNNINITFSSRSRRSRTTLRRRKLLVYDGRRLPWASLNLSPLRPSVPLSRRAFLSTPLPYRDDTPLGLPRSPAVLASASVLNLASHRSTQNPKRTPRARSRSSTEAVLLDFSSTDFRHRSTVEIFKGISDATTTRRRRVP